MKGFQDIRVLAYCVGAVYGMHVKWLTFSNEQFYEYHCYKWYPSIDIFAVVEAYRHFFYAGTGRLASLATPQYLNDQN